MDLEVPLLNKAIAYIETDDDKNKRKFIKEIAKNNSSITLMFVYSMLKDLEEKYKDNEKYYIVMDMFDKQLEVVTPDWISSYDETQRRFIKKKLK